MDNTLTLHGANPENLYTAFNLPMPDKILDFSTNTNILAWPEININLQELASRYPDPDCSKLRMLIAEREHISPSRILFTNGSNEAIFLLSSLFGEDTAIFQPAYSEYSRAFRNLHSIFTTDKASNRNLHSISTLEEASNRNLHSISTLDEASSRNLHSISTLDEASNRNLHRVFTLDEAHNFRHIIITNPNNPAGKYIPLREVICSHPDTVFIVDEAYIDFLLTAKPERLYDLENVILLRSLTKIFHISGARIGYVIAPERVIAAMRERQPSWSVNAIAQELALVFLRDEGFPPRTRAFYREQTPRFMQAVRDSGFETVQSDVHYFLVRVDDDLRVIEHLLKAGIVVRHTRNFTGLDGKYIRVATRQAKDNEFFSEILKSCAL